MNPSDYNNDGTTDVDRERSNRESKLNKTPEKTAANTDMSSTTKDIKKHKISEKCTPTKQNEKAKQFFVEFADGDKGWCLFAKGEWKGIALVGKTRTLKILENDKSIKAGDIVKIRHDNGTFYKGTVKRIKNQTK